MPADALVQLELLDRFRLTVDGRAVDVPPHSATLIAHLAIRDRPIHRTIVAGTLRPDLPDERALASLRSAIYRIGAPAAVVEATGQSLHLDPSVAVDLRDVGTIARSVALGGPPPDRPEPLVAMLRRDLLPDWDEPWIESERARHGHLRLRALERIAIGLTDAGRHAEAVEVALVAVGIEPACETAERVLIRALLAEGNRALAVREYEGFRRRLWKDLRVRPSTDLEQLGAQLLGRPLAGWT